MIRHRLCMTFVIAFLILGMYVPDAAAQTSVHFIPSNHTEGEPLPDVTRRANFAAICSASDGLQGLDLVRGYAGAATCPEAPSGELFPVGIDHVILVDDTRQLSADLQRMLSERQLLQSYRGRQIVRPGVVNMVEKGRDNGMNILIVGEMAYRQQGRSEVNWYVDLADITGSFDCDLRADDVATIADFATVTFELNNSMKLAMLQALNQFETAMNFSDSYSVEPKIGAALLRTALSEAKDYVVEKVSEDLPGVDVVVALLESVVAETERAEAAGRSHAMGVWIQTSRTLITDCTGNSQCGRGSGNSVSELSSTAIRDGIKDAVCQLPENRRSAGMQSIGRAFNNLEVGGRPSSRMYEKAIYESWINSHFEEAATSGGESLSGTIRILWEVEEGSGDTLSMDADTYVATVDVPDYGAKADASLNRIIDNTSVRRPMDFKVRKNVCFEVDNVNPGGRSIVCWLLDKDNNVKRQGVGSIDMAGRAFSGLGWRQATRRFKQ